MKLRWIGVALAAAMVLAACGQDTDTGPAPDDRHNDADESYVQVALGQVGSLSSLADLVDSHTNNDDVTDMAAAFTAELADAHDLLAQLEDDWDLPELVYDDAPVAATLPEQEPDPVWEFLEESYGDWFDAAWVGAAINQLESARSSAEKVLDDGRHDELADLAARIDDLADEWLDELLAIQEDLPVRYTD